jgi:hypothetical protein
LNICRNSVSPVRQSHHQNPEAEMPRPMLQLSAFR